MHAVDQAALVYENRRLVTSLESARKRLEELEVSSKQYFDLQCSISDFASRNKQKESALFKANSALNSTEIQLASTRCQLERSWMALEDTRGGILESLQRADEKAKVDALVCPPKLSDRSRLADVLASSVETYRLDTGGSDESESDSESSTKHKRINGDSRSGASSRPVTTSPPAQSSAFDVLYISKISELQEETGSLRSTLLELKQLIVEKDVDLEAKTRVIEALTSQADNTQGLSGFFRSSRVANVDFRALYEETLKDNVRLRNDIQALSNQLRMSERLGGES